MDKTTSQALSEATKKLKESKIPTPQLDAEVLLAFVLGKTREFLVAHEKQKLSPAQLSSFQFLISRRCLAEPIAHLTGHKEFFGLNFQVTKDTLIPRPETELLVEEALDLFRNSLQKKIVVVDVGTGSGNIIISLAKNIQHSTFNGTLELFAIDPSTKALEIAKQNAQEHEVLENINFLRGRFLNPLVNNPLIEIRKSSIVILANLPYLSEDIYNSSPISVKNFEPKKALLSGPDGLDHYSKLLNQIKLLVTGYELQVTALLEISPEQKSLITRKIKSQFPKAKIDLKKDLAGKWRVLVLRIL